MQLSTPQKHYGPRGFFAAILIIDMFVILAIDMFVPALASMQRDFDVSAAHLNLTMFCFIVGAAISIVVAGPLSDCVGRRPVMVVGCLLFAVASAGCAASPSIELLIAWRTVQSLGFGAIQALSTALLKDAYAGESLKEAMTFQQSIIVIGPVVAPFAGTFLLDAGGWRAIFACLAAFGVVSVALSLAMSETRSSSVRSGVRLGSLARVMARDVATLAKTRSFLALALIMGVTGVPYFAFLATASYVLLDYFAVGYLEYSVAYALACAVMVAAPSVYMALSKRLGVASILKVGLALVAASCVLLAVFGHMSAVLFIIAYAPCALSAGIIRPMAFVELLNQPDERVGAASSLANFTYNMITSAGTVLATLAWSTYIVGLSVLAGASCVVAALLLAWMTARR